MNNEDEMGDVALHDSMFALLKAAEKVQGRLDEALAAEGLSVPKFSVLSELVKSKEPLALCELANRLSCVRSNITQLVDRLEADGLVKRTDDPEDRRSVRAELTERGRERQAAGAEKVDQLRTDFESTLGMANRDALGRMLHAIT